MDVFLFRPADILTDISQRNYVPTVRVVDWLDDTMRLPLVLAFVLVYTSGATRLK